MSARLLTLAFLLSVLTTLMAAAAPPPISVIVDTDMGSDDLMAIAFLLQRPEVRIEAITIAHGLAHVDRGAANAARLLALAGHPEIPVYLGSERSLLPTAEFPAEWRRISDELPGVTLPNASRQTQVASAAEFLAQRLRDNAHPVTILATGALTNLAQAFQREPAAAKNIERLVIMGGAFHVPGNLGDGGLYQTGNKTAEWNIYIDPKAAGIVFASGAKIDLVPLDATSKVPLKPAFVKLFRSRAKGKLGAFVNQVLDSDRESIEGGYFQAWDPLAAVALVQPEVVAKWTAMTVEVRQSGNETGRTVPKQTAAANTRVALTANPSLFERVFVSAFAR